jgi:hypothetical protein
MASRLSAQTRGDATSRFFPAMVTLFDRWGWLVLFALFVSLLFNIGGAMFCIPLVLTPLMTTHGWNHTEVSAIPTVALLLSGFGRPVGRLVA